MNLFKVYIYGTFDIVKMKKKSLIFFIKLNIKIRGNNFFAEGVYVCLCIYLIIIIVRFM